MAFINGAYIPVRTKPAKCKLCKKIKELRPYGPNRAWVCFDCAMTNEEVATKAFGEMLEASKLKTLSAD